METKMLLSADRIRQALAGHAILSKEERDQAVLASIERVESANARANTARDMGYFNTADILDRLVDSHIDEMDQLLKLPVANIDASSWSIAP